MPGPSRSAKSRDELVHPLYLDVPMLISFLAALEGGVSLEDQSRSRANRTAVGEAELKGRVGSPAILSLLNLDMSGRLTGRKEEAAEEEVVAVRRHTKASLFNRLRARLADADAITHVGEDHDLAALTSGDIVDVRGEVLGNPLVQMLQLIVSMAPLAGIDIDHLLDGKYEKTAQQRAGKSGANVSAQPIDKDAAEGLRHSYP